MCVRELDESHFQVMSSLCISALLHCQGYVYRWGICWFICPEAVLFFSSVCATEHTHTNCVCVCVNVGDMGACMVICVFLSSCSCHKCVSAAYISLDTELSYTHWGELSLSGWLH